MNVPLRSSLKVFRRVVTMLNISNIDILAAFVKVEKIALFNIFTIRYILLPDVSFHRFVFMKGGGSLRVQIGPFKKIDFFWMKLSNKVF